MTTYKNVVRDERGEDGPKIIEWWLECVAGEIRLMARGPDGRTQTVADFCDGVLGLWALSKDADATMALQIDAGRYVVCSRLEK